MFVGYFDDSRSGSVFAVAGYIASEKQWARFNRVLWKNLLSKYGLTRLHRTELEGFHGEFSRERGWSESRRDAFVAEANQVIKRCTITAIGGAVWQPAWEHTMPPDLKRFYGGPYGWCVQSVLADVRKWSNEKRITTPLRWVFEAGTRGHGQVDRMFNVLYSDPETRRDYLIGGWSFESKDTVPLQSADVVAYEFSKYLANLGTRPTRKSALGLFRMEELNRRFATWDEKQLRKWLARQATVGHSLREGEIS
jgi:hypothetical protein